MAKEKSVLYVVSQKVNDFLEGVFGKWGEIVNRFPLPIMAVSLVIFFSLVYGFTIYEESTDEDQWTPIGCQALEDKDTVNEVFSEQPTRNVIYAVVKNSENIITLEAYREILDFDQRFKNEVQDGDNKFIDYCFKNDENETCETSNHPLEFFRTTSGEYVIDVINDNQLLERINSGKGYPALYPEGSSSYINVESMFGTTEPSEITINEDGINNVQKAAAISWTYYFNAQEDEEYYEGYDVEWEKFIDEFNSNSEHIELYLYSSTGISRGLEGTLTGDLMLVQIGIVLIILYTFLVVGKLYTYNSRLGVSLVGLIGIFMAYVEALGLGTYFGLEGSGVVSVLPFLLIGIGVDDMYVLLMTLNQVDIEQSPSYKMNYMLKHAGVSITITSLTNVCSFAISSIISLPAIRNFAIFTCFGMFFDYFNQITLFSAAVALDLRRTKKKMGDFCGLCFCKPESKTCCYGKYIYNQDGSVKEPLSKKFMRDYYAPFLTKTPVKIAVLVIFAAFFAVNVWGATELKMDFDLEWFVTGDAEIKDTFEVRDQYFNQQGQSLRVYTVDANFKNEEVQKSLVTLAEKFQECEGCSKDWVVNGSVNSWYNNFNSWVARGECNVSGRVQLRDGVIPSEHFNECMTQWKQTQEFNRYGSNLEFNSNEELIGSIIGSEVIDPENSSDSVDLMEETRSICNEYGPGNTFPYNPEFLYYEQYAVFDKEAIASILSALATIFVIVLVMTADILGAVLVLSMVSLTIVSLLALLYFWDDTLNMVTITNAIMSIGVTVDYNVHIAHSFKGCNDSTKNKRVIKAMDDLGVAVVNGSISTFLAIIVLSGSNSYIFTQFFKSWFAIVVFGSLHGLVLLPVILSYIGPAANTHGETQKVEDKSEKHQGSLKDNSQENQEA